MTEVCSKGLLPQLTDVLHALADSHELLLCKVRSVRLEREVVLHSADGHDIPHAEFLDVLDFVDRHPNAVVEPFTATASIAHDSIPLPEVESADLMRENRPACVDATAASALQADDEVRLDEFNTMHPMAPTRLDAAHPDAPHAINAEPAGSGSSNRNYNYFDELDARLSHLGRADPEQVHLQPSGLLSSHDRS